MTLYDHDIILIIYAEYDIMIGYTDIMDNILYVTYDFIPQLFNSINQGCVKVIPKMCNIRCILTVVIDASDSKLHQDYTIVTRLRKF
jgi:hypothetical protein